MKQEINDPYFLDMSEFADNSLSVNELPLDAGLLEEDDSLTLYDFGEDDSLTLYDFGEEPISIE